MKNLRQRVSFGAKGVCFLAITKISSFFLFCLQPEIRTEPLIWNTITSSQELTSKLDSWQNMKHKCRTIL